MTPQPDPPQPDPPQPGLPRPDLPPAETLHASCVAVSGRGLLILGPSGSGKSALALRMIALGAALVADDRTILTRRGDALHATCPPPLSGLVEARGVGLLRLPVEPEARLFLAVDLAQVEAERMPPPRTITRLGCELDLVLHVQSAHFPDALLLLLTHGRPT